MIFISYRRRDVPYAVDWLSERLSATFGKDAVFLDIDAIPVGEVFRAHIEQVLAHSHIAIVAIGPNWLERDANGQSRLNDPDDMVRTEVALALAKPDLIVIPVLFGDAELPAKSDLPDDMHGLLDHNTLDLRRGPRFREDMAKLTQAIRRHPAMIADVPGADLIRMQSDGPHAAWEAIKDSLNAEDYDTLLRVFPNTPEAWQAERHKQQLAEWEQVDHDQFRTLESFCKTGPFPALLGKAEQRIDHLREVLTEYLLSPTRPANLGNQCKTALGALPNTSQIREKIGPDLIDEKIATSLEKLNRSNHNNFPVFCQHIRMVHILKDSDAHGLSHSQMDFVEHWIRDAWQSLDKSDLSKLLDFKARYLSPLPQHLFPDVRAAYGESYRRTDPYFRKFGAAQILYLAFVFLLIAALVAFFVSMI